MASVPKITVIVRKSYGMAISNMCGSNCGADFLVSMTTGEISVMSPESAANVAFRDRIDEAENPEEEGRNTSDRCSWGVLPGMPPLLD